MLVDILCNHNPIIYQNTNHYDHSKQRKHVDGNIKEACKDEHPQKGHGQPKGNPKCQPGVQVRLIKADQIMDQTRTDAFGDFKFDGLPANSGAYRIGIFKEGWEGASLALNLKDSLSVGTIWIEELQG